MKLSPTTKRVINRVGNVALGLWLSVVLFAYFGVLKLTGVLADVALLTVLAIIISMIWKYALKPLMRLGRGRS